MGRYTPYNSLFGNMSMNKPKKRKKKYFKPKYMGKKEAKAISKTLIDNLPKIKKHARMEPNADWDGDGLKNKHDCDPINPYKQGPTHDKINKLKTNIMRLEGEWMDEQNKADDYWQQVVSLQELRKNLLKEEEAQKIAIKNGTWDSMFSVSRDLEAVQRDLNENQYLLNSLNGAFQKVQSKATILKSKMQQDEKQISNLETQLHMKESMDTQNQRKWQHSTETQKSMDEMQRRKEDYGARMAAQMTAGQTHKDERQQIMMNFMSGQEFLKQQRLDQMQNPELFGKKLKTQSKLKTGHVKTEETVQKRYDKYVKMGYDHDLAVSMAHRDVENMIENQEKKKTYNWQSKKISELSLL